MSSSAPVRWLVMRRLSFPVMAGVAAVAAFATGASAQDELAPVEPPSGEVSFLGLPITSETLAAGSEIYALRCAACHGSRLEGQPDWKRRLANGRMPAPPHDASGHTWHHSDQDLFTITKGGLAAVLPDYESDMPAFGAQLSDADITAVLAFIKSTWPERQRGFQAEVTANAMAAEAP